MEIFDEEWLAAAATALSALPAVDGASAVVDYVVSGAPAGKKVTIGATVADGRVTALRAGKSDDPDVVVSLDYDTALEILEGRMSSDAGFMNGALKVEGAHERWLLGLRPVRLAVVDALAPLMADTVT